MQKRLSLLVLVALVLSVATPSYATLWNNGGKKNDKKNNPPKFVWPKFDLPKYDWPKNDPPKGHECDRWCGCKDNVVPEPATAGLAFMGMGALALTTRRRK